MMSATYKKKGALVPRLRFPEFQNAGEWEWKKLKNVCEINPSSETLPQTFIYIDLESVSAGKLLSKKTILLEEAPSRAQRLLKNGDIIFQMVRPYQKNNLYCNFNDKKNYVASTGYALLRALEDNIFLYQAIHCDNFVDSVISKCTGSNYPAINSSDLSELVISIPRLQEQQRIADCLSSLDERIAAETNKLDTLKDHKKGLLKQLFPAEGETLPALRFPEFRDAGEWERVPLGSQTTKVGSGVTPKGGDKNYVKKGRPFIRSQNVGWGKLILDDIAFISEDVHATFISTEIKNNDILLNITGASIGRCAFADKRIVGGNVNQHVCILRTKSKIMNNMFLMQYILSEYGQNKIDSFQAGSNRQGLNFAQIKSLSIPIPPRITVKQHGCLEQQRIADCLSSLDELIAAQTQKIELLKDHKKGLMQQLFPRIDEVRA